MTKRMITIIAKVQAHDVVLHPSTKELVVLFKVVEHPCKLLAMTIFTKSLTNCFLRLCPGRTSSSSSKTSHSKPIRLIRNVRRSFDKAFVFKSAGFSLVAILSTQNQLRLNACCVQRRRVARCLAFPGPSLEKKACALVESSLKRIITLFWFPRPPVSPTRNCKTCLM